ncbi:hypothetical protein CB1_001428035 [Camelus ferus]|nr:hypothetical protein CB1_001428035 [Camelus ferus]
MRYPCVLSGPSRFLLLLLPCLCCYSSFIGDHRLLAFAAAPEPLLFAWCFTPGTFANQIQAAFWENLWLLLTPGPAMSLSEASGNVPTSTLCNTGSPLRYVDTVIPCSNKTADPVGLMWWMLVREVLGDFRLKRAQKGLCEAGPVPGTLRIAAQPGAKSKNTCVSEGPVKVEPDHTAFSWKQQHQALPSE